MRKIFELDAARPDAEPGITALWKGLDVTAIDGTTMELARNVTPEGEFGTPANGAGPLLRAVAHVRTASRRWIGLPPLRIPARRPPRRADQRHHRPAPAPARTTAHIRQDSSRTPHQARRGSRYTIDITKPNLPKWDTTPET
jgi:hypothetical protein